MSTPIHRYYQEFDVDEGEVWAGVGDHPAQLQLFDFRLHLVGGAALYLQLWEDHPSNAGSRLRYSFVIDPGKNFILDFGSNPVPFAAIGTPAKVTSLYWSLEPDPETYAGASGASAYVSAHTRELSIIV
jgi:hypothetical protein